MVQGLAVRAAHVHTSLQSLPKRKPQATALVTKYVVGPHYRVVCCSSPESGTPLLSMFAMLIQPKLNRSASSQPDYWYITVHGGSETVDKDTTSSDPVAMTAVQLK